MEDLFRKFSATVSSAIGSFWFLVFIALLVLGTGDYFDFSAAWKSNVSLIATLSALALLSFLQHSQDHSDKAAHLKLDELINSNKYARNETLAVEEEPKSKIKSLKQTHKE